VKLPFCPSLFHHSHLSLELWEEDEVGGTCGTNAGEEERVGKREGKRTLGRPRRRWIDNFKMDVLEIGLSVVDWTGLAQDRYRWRALVNWVMNLWVP
jgi:hypothetical protein